MQETSECIEPDVQLVFGGDKPSLMTHSCLLSLASPVLRVALELDRGKPLVQQVETDDVTAWTDVINILDPSCKQPPAVTWVSVAVGQPRLDDPVHERSNITCLTRPPPA
jgi:hypothetical protein